MTRPNDYNHYILISLGSHERRIYSVAVETGKKTTKNTIKIEICDSIGRCCNEKEIKPAAKGHNTLLWGKDPLGTCNLFPTVGSLYLDISLTEVNDEWFGEHVQVTFDGDDSVMCPIKQYMGKKVTTVGGSKGKTKLRTNCHEIEKDESDDEAKKGK